MTGKLILVESELREAIRDWVAKHHPKFLETLRISHSELVIHIGTGSPYASNGVPYATAQAQAKEKS